VEGNPVFLYHDAFNPNVAEVEDLKTRYRVGKVGDVEVKTKLAAAVDAMLEPMRERRAATLARPGYLMDVLRDGSAKARGHAAETLERARDAMNLTYRAGPAGRMMPAAGSP
jgi:tryptophanyl-tRNA synthetase